MIKRKFDQKEYSKKYYLKNKKKMKEYWREYRQKNKGKGREYSKRYKKNNKDKIRKCNKQYRQKNKMKHNAYIRQRKKTDMNFLIESRIRSNLNYALKYYTKTGKAMSSEKYGIDYNSIIKKLTPLPFPISERSNWHIDHVRPVSSFDLTNPEEVKKCFSSKNLQWLPAKENLSKGGRF